MNLLVFEKKDLITPNCIAVHGERAQHLREVLRVRTGDSLRIGEIGGGIGCGTVAEVSAERVSITFGPLNQTSQAPSFDVILALPRPQILKRVLHTSAMMGVRHLFLIRSARVEKSYFSSPLLQPQKMFSYLREGLEQGVSTILPQVSLHQRFRGFLEEELPRATEQTSCALLAEPSAEQSLWALARSRGFRNGENALLAVGPEGGWQDHEVAAFRDHGFAPFHCGPRVLRVDAAVCSLLGQIDLLRHLGGHC